MHRDATSLVNSTPPMYAPAMLMLLTTLALAQIQPGPCAPDGQVVERRDGGLAIGACRERFLAGPWAVYDAEGRLELALLTPMYSSPLWRPTTGDRMLGMLGDASHADLACATPSGLNTLSSAGTIDWVGPCLDGEPTGCWTRMGTRRAGPIAVVCEDVGWQMVWRFADRVSPVLVDGASGVPRCEDIEAAYEPDPDGVIVGAELGDTGDCYAVVPMPTRQATP